jgi:hypothetical protein
VSSATKCAVCTTPEQKSKRGHGAFSSIIGPAETIWPARTEAAKILYADIDRAVIIDEKSAMI